MKWLKDKVKALGVWLSTDLILVAKLNYEDKIKNLKASLGSWELRRLSLLGKITVLKSLIVSQLVYVLSPLSIDQKAIQEINSLCYDFLWGGRDKIKRDIMIDDFGQGRLKMVDVPLFAKSLKSTWIKKYSDQNNRGK